LQTVSGVVLAAIGLSYEEPARLGQVLGYTTGVERNDTTLKAMFPFVQTPWPGNCNCAGQATGYVQPAVLPPSASTMGIAAPEFFMTTAPNPASGTTTIRYRVETPSQVLLEVYNEAGNRIQVLVNQRQEEGTYTVPFNTSTLSSGIYFVKAVSNGQIKQALRIVKN